MGKLRLPLQELQAIGGTTNLFPPRFRLGYNQTVSERHCRHPPQLSAPS